MLKSLVLVVSIGFCFPLRAQVEFFGDPEPLEPLNTPVSENYIFFDYNNSEIYFSRIGHENNVGGQNDKGDILYSKLDSAWASPDSLLWNDEHFAAPLGFSGDYFLFNKVWFSKGLYYGGVFAVKDRQEPFQVEIPFFKNRSPLQTGSISADGRYLLLSMENNLSYGVDDLFVCILQSDGSWSPPKNLGNVVNTSLQEVTPFLAEDNRTLFFSTNGLEGEGSFDLYRSERLDDTWQNWSDPENLGTAVNTSGSETSFVFKSREEYAYFVSTQNSDGYGDIKRIRITSDIEVAQQDTVMTMKRDEEEQQQLKFVLADKRTGQPISGLALWLQNEDTVQYATSEPGEVTLEAGTFPMSLEFKSEGYLSVKKLVGVGFRTADTIKLEPLKTGNIITLEHVLFYRGTANFIEGSESELDLVLEMLNENPEIKILLQGHTDNVGNATLNLQLSQERVQAVEDYLISKGIDPSRISGKGFGGSQPVASNAEENTRKLNRRVEFEVVRD